MWPAGLSLALMLVRVLAGSEDGRELFRPRNCTLHCVYQGVQGCEYCRISKEDIQTSLGSASVGLFGGHRTPEVCQHYVDAPQNVSVDFMDSQDPKYDAVVVSWSPSHYGIAFLQGFEVILQALGGTRITCQLYLLQNNMSLSTMHAQRVYYSDPFSDLSLDTQYAVTVLALPVPEPWNKFYHSKLFFTRSCPEKNGLDKCKTDWYPRQVDVHQQYHDIVVTFSLAPEDFGISRYFSMCFAEGSRTHYKIIQPDLSINRTHHTFRWLSLHVGTNYTCEIAADIVDAVRRSFFVQVQHESIEPKASGRAGLSLDTLLCLVVPVVLSLAGVFALLCQKKLRKKPMTGERSPEIIEEYYDKSMDEQSYIELASCARPPQLLICYSSNDGPAHIKVVLQLATFLQKHMAIQVHLDLWDTLSITVEGVLGWYWKRMKESDFVLVICSAGLNLKQQSQSEEDLKENTSPAILSMVGEEIRRSTALRQNLSKYMSAIFEYSQETDVPSILSLASYYNLPNELDLLFSHLHGVTLQKPGSCLQVTDISNNACSEVPAGAALLQAIQEAKILLATSCPSKEEMTMGNLTIM